jgi:serine/threonine-protein phosphatase 6 catalytic subunit
MDIDRLLALLDKGEIIPELDLKRLCSYALDIFLEESNVQPISSPVNVCGDIHG